MSWRKSPLKLLFHNTDDRKGHADTAEEETLLQQHNKNIKERFSSYQQYIKETISQFDSNESPDILIVVNMLLTGFDVPRNTILYIDRPFLEKHNLLQATARVNRIFPHKEFGYVIDYHGNLKNFLDAVSHYDILAQQAEQEEFAAFEQKEIQDSIRKIEDEVKNCLGIMKSLSLYSTL